MNLLKTLATRATIKEAESADSICLDKDKIGLLADAAVKQLITTYGGAVKSTRMAVIANQVRSSVDSALLADKIRLNKDNLNKVVDCVLNHIKANFSAYKLDEATSSPEKQLYYTTRTKNDGWVVVDMDTDEIVKYADSEEHAKQRMAELIAKHSSTKLDEAMDMDEIIDEVAELKSKVQDEQDPVKKARLKSELQRLCTRYNIKMNEGASPLEDLKDELEVLKAELADESDAKKRNLIRNQIARLRNDIAKGKRGVAEGYNGVPLDTILAKFPKEYAAFKAGGDLDDSSDFYDELYDYYNDQMPYGVQKARDGDPLEWISDRLADEE